MDPELLIDVCSSQPPVLRLLQFSFKIKYYLSNMIAKRDFTSLQNVWLAKLITSMYSTVSLINMNFYFTFSVTKLTWHCLYFYNDVYIHI